MTTEKINVIPLGPMGWIPTGGNHACCYCFEMKDTLVVLDAGTGVARFAEPPYNTLIEKCEKIVLLLSHYHLDHISGLIYLPFFFKEKEFHIAGPGKEIYNRSTEEILTQITSPPYFSRPIADFPMDMYFHDLGTGPADIAGLKIETILQAHSDPSLGIKVENTVCYCTDTACSEETVGFAECCNILLHESWFDSADYQRLQQEATVSQAARKTLKAHSGVEPVAHIAAKANVDELMLIHLNPAYNEERLKNMEKEAQEIFKNSYLASGHAARAPSYPAGREANKTHQ